MENDMPTTSTNDPTLGLRSAEPDRLQGSMGALSDDVGRAGQRGVKAMEGAAREGAERLSSAAYDAADGLSTAADDTVERASDAASRYAATGRQLRDEMRERITAYPWHAVGIAAAAGFIVVRMMR
jgi:ElaB/YqjD/DUF883 family membrane-anchored ribosome-binding protein